MNRKEILQLDTGGPDYNRAKVQKLINNTLAEYDREYTRDPKRMERRSLKAPELKELLQEDIISMILDAYNIGFVQGMRYEKGRPPSE